MREWRRWFGGLFCCANAAIPSCQCSMPPQCSRWMGKGYRRLFSGLMLADKPPCQGQRVKETPSMHHGALVTWSAGPNTQRASLAGMEARSVSVDVHWWRCVCGWRRRTHAKACLSTTQWCRSGNVSMLKRWLAAHENRHAAQEKGEKKEGYHRGRARGPAPSLTGYSTADSNNDSDSDQQQGMVGGGSKNTWGWVWKHMGTKEPNNNIWHGLSYAATCRSLCLEGRMCPHMRAQWRDGTGGDGTGQHRASRVVMGADL